MKFILDTHLLIWAGDWLESDIESSPLSHEAIELLKDRDNQFLFSAVSVWEVAIKNAQGRVEFLIEPNMFRRSLLSNEYEELVVDSRHGAAVGALPSLHKDPFDRLLIAQATVEGITLLTADKTVATYPGPIRLV
jgi:PIN domain nuclease of toxin-antitoxin system